MRTVVIVTGVLFLSTLAFAAPQKRDVVSHYAVLAHAVYEDSLTAAKALQGAVDRLIAEPTEKNLAAARIAWTAARVPYQQSEVYRFGNAIVDDWEGKVNAWPLDEGLIDYVAASYGAASEENPAFRANVIASCDRRAAYLKAATDLLVDDLAWMAAQWASGGKAQEGLVKGAPDQGLTAIVTGMGSLSYGELAGERMKLGLLLHDPEEEHDCFSDNTHYSHYYDALGIRNIYLGEYRRTDGSTVRGPGLSALMAAADPAVDALRLASVQFEGSDSLDNPEAVFQ